MIAFSDNLSHITVFKTFLYVLLLKIWFKYFIPGPTAVFCFVYIILKKCVGNNKKNLTVWFCPTSDAQLKIKRTNHFLLQSRFDRNGSQESFGLAAELAADAGDCRSWSSLNPDTYRPKMSGNSLWLPLSLLLLQLAGIVVFLSGFLAPKVPLPGFASFEDFPSPGNCNGRQGSLLCSTLE